jgi:hypothetical protein
MVINSTSSSINDVSISFLWALAFFSEPLACSPFLFLWAYDGSDASRICVSMHVACPYPSSMDIFCASIFISFVHTCPITPLVSFSMCGSPCVEPRCDFFFLVNFCMVFLPPSLNCAVLFFWIVSFVHISYEGILRSCVLVFPPGIIFGIVGTLHSLGHS